MNQNLQALIFDVDGTLADTERQGHRVAFNQAFAANHLDWHWSEDLYGDLLQVAGGKERIRYYLREFQGPLQTELQNSQRLDSFVAQLHQAKTAKYQQLLAEGSIPLRPGVQRLIQSARSQGIKLAIAPPAPYRMSWPF